ncbi:MAG: phosphoglucosamine mutase [Candidatus Heimdallarchaeaceae archaeon]
MKKPRYFGTNGIRGIVNDLITPAFITKMGYAIGSFVSKGLVVVGADARTSSPFIKNAIISSLLASGLEVIDVGTLPTPALQFAVTYFHAKLGVMVTASHNPPEFNGIKIVDSDGIEIGISKQLEIEELYEKNIKQLVTWDNISSVTRYDILPFYIKQIVNHVNQDLIKQANLTVVVDAGNAVGGLVTPYLLKELGVRVITLNAHLDGSFPGRGSEPLPEKLTLMSHAIQVSNAHFGVAHDGDADRAIFGDNSGMVYYGDRSIALFEKWILSSSSQKLFVTPVSSSKVVEDIAEEFGGKIIWTPVGCINVSRTMLETSAIIGGEENGGLFYAPHQSVRDGPMAAALMAEILSETKEQLKVLLDQLPNYFQLKDKVPCGNNHKTTVMNYIKENTPPANDVITIDGIKLIYDDGWILIRPSGTEPIFRIFVEATTAEKAKELMSHGKNLLISAIKSCSN